MIRVKINGNYSDGLPGNAARFTDLIELIKTEIDPEHMITSILIDGSGQDAGCYGRCSCVLP
jgi:hypothetical protein